MVLDGPIGGMGVFESGDAPPPSRRRVRPVGSVGPDTPVTARLGRRGPLAVPTPVIHTAYYGPLPGGLARGWRPPNRFTVPGQAAPALSHPVFQVTDGDRSARPVERGM